MEKATRKDPEGEPPLKQFTTKINNLVMLQDCTKGLGEEYWDRHKCVVTPGSIIEHKELFKIAERLELKERAKVREICYRSTD